MIDEPYIICIDKNDHNADGIYECVGYIVDIVDDGRMKTFYSNSVMDICIIK